jgi:hypothetical protein
MKLTTEDIMKYGTREEKKFLKEGTDLFSGFQIPDGPEKIVSNTFRAWVRKNESKLSDEFFEMYNEQDWSAYTPSYGKEVELVLGTIGQNAEGVGAQPTDFLTVDQIDELENLIKRELKKAYPVETLKKWHARKDLWDNFKIIGYEDYEWNEDKWGANL